MKRQRIYIDTSVLGGCFDPEFAPWSVLLMENFRAGRFMPVLSELVSTETINAPNTVLDLLFELRELGAENLIVTPEVVALAGAYENRSILTAKYRTDGLHIALATVAEVDLLVSWNFRHIVRFDKIRLFTAVNIERGYKPLTIYSPREVAYDARVDD